MEPRWVCDAQANFNKGGDAVEHGSLQVGFGEPKNFLKTRIVLQGFMEGDREARGGMTIVSLNPEEPSLGWMRF
jgi:hypothetical protein